MQEEVHLKGQALTILQKCADRYVATQGKNSCLQKAILLSLIRKGFSNTSHAEYYVQRSMHISHLGQQEDVRAARSSSAVKKLKDVINDMSGLVTIQELKGGTHHVMLHVRELLSHGQVDSSSPANTTKDDDIFCVSGKLFFCSPGNVYTSMQCAFSLHIFSLAQPRFQFLY